MLFRIFGQLKLPPPILMTGMNKVIVYIMLYSWFTQQFTSAMPLVLMLWCCGGQVYGLERVTVSCSYCLSMILNVLVCNYDVEYDKGRRCYAWLFT